MKRVFEDFNHAMSILTETGVGPMQARDFLMMARALDLITWHDAPKYGAGTGDLSEPQCGELIR